MTVRRFATPIHYFAYGGDMNAAQIKARSPWAKRVTTGILRDYRLAFYGHSQRWDGAEETVEPAVGAIVCGVVYELSHSALDRLDAWQGVRLDGSGRYFHSPTDILGTDGKRYAALTYRKDILGVPRPPSTEFLAYLIAGAEENKLPADYVRALQATPSTAARYVVPQADDVEAVLRAMPACAC